MPYRALRALARVALRWFYRDIEVVGIERVPATGPVLIASNHPNALADALVIGTSLRRPVTLTAKATLFDRPVARLILHITGVVPLRRASDELARAPTSGADPARNADAFARVLDVLEGGAMVLLFPEGRSHSDPALVPLKTGLARISTHGPRARSHRPGPDTPGRIDVRAKVAAAIAGPGAPWNSRRGGEDHPLAPAADRSRLRAANQSLAR
jgi:1-acyl-sn-glycerol-3-phosphate acyltransferase